MFLAGKCFAISGAASGIGQGVANHLATLGAHLSLGDIDLERVTAQAEKLRASGCTCIATRVDVRQRADIDDWIGSTVEALGRLDGAVNCAGVFSATGDSNPIASKSEEEWDDVIDINLTGMFRCLRAELAAMTRGGSVVNLTSTVGMQGLPFAAPYCVSKHGVCVSSPLTRSIADAWKIIGLTRCAAKECASRRIRVNAVAPGTIDTPMLGPNTGRSRDEMLAEVAGHTPMNRLGTVEEIAKTVAFLLSEDSSFTTGAVRTKKLTHTSELLQSVLSLLSTIMSAFEDFVNNSFHLDFGTLFRPANATQPLAEGYGLLLCSLCVIYASAYMTYNIYFHPLARFPGPFWARSTLLWRLFHTMGGRFHRAIDREHKRYGPVFRVAPNELSFSSVSSWKAIYGHQPPGKQPHIKSEFYNMYGSGYKSLCVGSERDPTRHVAMKRNLTSAFSTRALLEQEDIVDRCVNEFVTTIGAAEGAHTTGLNMTKWYEMISFDILGEMAFGESFHAVESGHPHFWSELIVSHLYFITVLDNLRRYPLFATIGRFLLPFATTSVRDKHSGFTREKVDRRLAAKAPRTDFMTTLISKVSSGEIEKEEMTAHASTLVIAGGETTSTFLAAVTYYLLSTPKTYHCLQREIREAFDSYEDIDASSAQKLPYLQAVIAEGLRMYPPGSQGFPRVSSGVEIDGHWVPAGAEMYTSAWTVTHDAKYFPEPFVFNPERWIDPHAIDVKEASQPFSLGPRGCLGRNFAYVEMNLILAKMHWTYDFDLVDKELDWEANSHIHVMWWKPDLWVRLVPKDKA
ncbi:Cytochrome P450 monooxygenase orf9 [Paraphaeosphaeria minitans]